MARTNPSRIGLVEFGGSGFVLRSPGQDPRGRGVYGPDGERMGIVGDLYVDRERREVRFLRVEAGGLIGVGKGHVLVPAGSVTEMTEDRVTVGADPERGGGQPPAFDPVVTPAVGRGTDRGGPPDDLGERHRETLARFPFGFRPY